MDDNVVNKLKNKIKELEKENMVLISSGSGEGSGSGDNSSLIQKIKLLEDEKSVLANDYEKKISKLNSNIKTLDEEMEVCLSTIEEIQEENHNLTNEKKNEINLRMEDTLRINRQNVSLDFTKFQNEIEQLKAEKKSINNRV